MDKLRSWDEVRAEFFTPEEIAESDRCVAKIGRKRKKRMAKNDSPLGGDALEFMDSLLTPEEIAESNCRVAMIGAEIEAREHSLKSDNEVESFVTAYIEKQRQNGVNLLKEHVEAIYRIVRGETTAEEAFENLQFKSEVYFKLQEAECEAALTDERYSTKDVLKAMKNAISTTKFI